MEKAYILLSCEIGEEHDLASQLRAIDEIKGILITFGEYDIVVEAETTNSDKMDELITSKIRKLDKIRSTITLRVTN
ncbi:MAG: AsnC family transcriptional regulator [Thaumarchaeota archaeon CSP1-1]|jgi:DNA-binding Lrp family transcriptional regulator|nr:MAG: AsnC family transcriptional regulator [Thaumarchaeota archaeon CSP1-1]